MKYFVSAIGTDSGKTIASAILTEALAADYWKPVQAGFPTDSETVRRLISPHLHIHPEQHLLKTPASPHAAAELEGKQIKISDIKAPETQNTLIIEGAGGLMVPLNQQEMVADLIPHLNAQLILVSNIYLGSINHTLLSLELIRSRGYTLKGIIFNGPETPSTQRIIMEYAEAPCLLHIQPEEEINRTFIIKYAEKLKSNWHQLAE